MDTLFASDDSIIPSNARHGLLPVIPEFHVALLVPPRFMTIYILRCAGGIKMTVASQQLCFASAFSSACLCSLRCADYIALVSVVFIA